MVTSSFDQHSLTGRIVLSANRSMSWAGNLALIVSLAVLALLISLLFLWQGYWLILPFGILEIALVSTGLYLCSRDSFQQEIITLELVQVPASTPASPPSNQLASAKNYAIFPFVGPAEEEDTIIIPTPPE